MTKENFDNLERFKKLTRKVAGNKDNPDAQVQTLTLPKDYVSDKQAVYNKKGYAVSQADYVYITVKGKTQLLTTSQASEHVKEKEEAGEAIEVEELKKQIAEMKKEMVDYAESIKINDLNSKPPKTEEKPEPKKVEKAQEKPEENEEKGEAEKKAEAKKNK